ncbi:restriction endonuclease subunit S [Rugamonas rivuli]|uniref:Restriction endonuclease subunit S n=1 Tax=Rugamonas rivuli TaxID=2743358 RepID=A0A843S9T2_9BURK|nr:restriction endonuclease subunit S [Rugamonas rivuli]MQA21245.1 restriction endonuclease subunit S [Rugamonas rivuli]
MSKQAKKGLLPERRFPEFQDKGAWERSQLGALSTIVRGGSPRPIEAFLTRDVNGLNWLKIGDVDKGSKYVIHTEERVKDSALSKTRVVNNGDLIMSNSMSFGRPYIMKIASCIHDGWIAVTNINDNIDRDYLYYLILSNESQIYFFNSAAGGGVKNLNAEIIKALPVAFPQKDEQQKIAHCLASIDDLIAAQAQKLIDLKNHKRGLLQRLFPMEGETVPKHRFPEFQDQDKWVASTIGDISEITSGGTPSRSMPEYWDGDIPWVSTTLIDFNTIKNVNEYITQDGLNNSSTKIIPEGALLMAMYGQGITRGKVAKLGIDATINQACAAILLNDKVNAEFVFQNLAARYDEIRKISNPGGQENLSATLIKQIPFSYPNIESGEQQKIATCLASIDKLIAAQTQKLDAFKAHKKGLMQQLFPKMDEESA